MAGAWKGPRGLQRRDLQAGLPFPQTPYLCFPWAEDLLVVRWNLLRRAAGDLVEVSVN